MDNQTKVIFTLLAIVLILAIIFGLKITGVIKPAEKSKEIVKEQNVIDEKTNEVEISKIYNENFLNSILGFIIKYQKLISFVIFAITVFTSIGLAKLYKKFSMPDWAINFNYMYPIIVLIMGFTQGIIRNILSLFVSLTALSCISKFFGCLEMSEWWPLSMALGLIVTIIGLIRGGINIISIIGILLILLYIYAHIISCIKLADETDRGIGFTIGLIILPSIFKPILGYLK